MKKSIHVISAIILALGLSNAWAADTSTADKPGMQNGETKGMDMDKDHMKQMHEHMDDMHKSMGKSDAMKGDGKCEMKSDGKCDAKDMKSMSESAADKAKAPAKDADDHAAHH